MENLKNSTLSLPKVSWPIFVIRDHEWISKGKIKDKYGVRVLDNINATGNLGQRRLTIKPQDLYPLKKAIYNLKDMLKISRRNKTFIDSEGKVFRLQKKKYYPLLYKKIIKQFLVENVGTVFYLAGINTPFEVKGILNSDIKYVGVLKIGKGYLLYEFSKERKKKSRKLI